MALQAKVATGEESSQDFPLHSSAGDMQGG